MSILFRRVVLLDYTMGLSMPWDTGRHVDESMSMSRKSKLIRPFFCLHFSSGDAFGMSIALSLAASRDGHLGAPVSYMDLTSGELMVDGGHPYVNHVVK
jgi:hypothetical protein